MDKLLVLAKKELDVDVDGFGGFLNREKLYDPKYMLIILSAIVSVYYVKSNNREELDEYLKLAESKLFNNDFGPVSLQSVLKSLVNELEELIK